MATFNLIPHTPALGVNPKTMAQYGAAQVLNIRTVEMPYDKMVVPVTFKLDSDSEGFTFPLDPLVSISGKNSIVCRNIARYDNMIRGTIKEKWNTNDWEISIAGLLISDENHTVEDYLYKLRHYIEADTNIKLICPYIEKCYDITRIVIESYDFPFTKGEENQTFTLKCKSDDERINLLI